MSAQAAGSRRSRQARRPPIEDPPFHFDGTPPLLDRSWQRVDDFARRKPGGVQRSDDKGAAAGQEGVDGEVDGDGDGLEEEVEVDDNARAGPSRSPSPSSRRSPGASASDSEWEYEDLPPQLVLFDMSLTAAEAKRLRGGSRNISVVGLETNQPHLKVGNVPFLGSWRESIGTGLILQDHRDPSRPFPHQHHPAPLNPPLPSTTENILVFKRAIDLTAAEASAQQRREHANASIQTQARAKARANDAGRKESKTIRGKGKVRFGVDGSEQSDGGNDGEDDAQGQPSGNSLGGDAGGAAISAEQQDDDDDDDREEEDDAERQEDDRTLPTRTSKRRFVSKAQKTQRGIDWALTKDDRKMNKRATKMLSELQNHRIQSQQRREVAAPTSAAEGVAQKRQGGRQRGDDDADGDDGDVEMAGPLDSLTGNAEAGPSRSRVPRRSAEDDDDDDDDDRQDNVNNNDNEEARRLDARLDSVLFNVDKRGDDAKTRAMERELKEMKRRLARMQRGGGRAGGGGGGAVVPGAAADGGAGSGGGGDAVAPGGDAAAAAANRPAEDGQARDNPGTEHQGQGNGTSDG